MADTSGFGHPQHFVRFFMKEIGENSEGIWNAASPFVVNDLDVKIRVLKILKIITNKSFFIYVVKIIFLFLLNQIIQAK